MPAHEKEDLDLLEAAVREAGHIARKFYGGDYKRWNKEGGSPVTEADLAVNKLLHERLTSARPAIRVSSARSIAASRALTQRMAPRCLAA